MARVKYKRRGTLHMLAGLLVLSAVLRVMPGAGLAMAEASDDSPLVDTVMQQPATDIGPVDDALLTALREKEQDLQRREAQMADRMQAIRVAEEELADQLAALEAAEASLRTTMSQVQAASETDLARLATVYENMKPREAAPLFAQMPPGFAAGFLGLMSPEAAAPIMANLPPEAAYSISVMLAGRNANVPTE